MTVTINLSPEVAQVLEERARQAGQSLAELAADLLAAAARNRGDIPPGERQAEIAARLLALERVGAYDTRRRAGLPPLSDQDVSRERIYEGRGQ